MKNIFTILIIVVATTFYCKAQVEFEPNNTILQNSASNAFTAPDTIGASISNSDVDFIRIDLPYCAAWQFNLINPLGAPCNLKLYVYNAQNLANVIVNGADFNFSLGIPSPVTINGAQTVYVQIDQTSGSDLGSYSLVITPSLTDNMECNNYFAEAGLLPVDTSIQMKLWGTNFNGAPDVDYYKAIVPRCGVLNITASNIGGGAATSQDIQFTVYQPDTITQIGSAGGGNCDATTISGAFLVQPGIVYIKVDDNTGSLNCQGGYDLSNTPFTLTLAFDITDACECNNSFRTACQVDINPANKSNCGE